MTGVSASIERLPLRHLRRGKVREVYEVDTERLLLVASDRVSAFDVVMRETIPHKGAVLTQLTAWWLRHFDKTLRHHLITADADEIVKLVPSLERYRAAIAGRAMLCHRTEVFPVECVVRGYISGSAWKEYKTHGTLAGEKMPAGLQESARFAEPIFSPATKAEVGHDENITFDRMKEIIGADSATELRRLSLLVYDQGRGIAAERGIIIADTKFEFGRDRAGRVTLIDEVLTPDSSRFWPTDRYAPGRPQPSFDKQPLRDYLDAQRQAGWWNGEVPPPPLPADVVRATSERYLDAYRRITGTTLTTEQT